MGLFYKRKADDIIAPLTNMIDALKEHRDISDEASYEHEAQARAHQAEARRAREHLEKLEAIFGK